MANNNHFSKAPNINIPRSRFKVPFQHKTTFAHGKLIPIDCFEVIPGDTFSLNLSTLLRLSTPIAPIMDNIDAYVHAFFVPMRLIWSHTEEFYGANKDSAGVQETIYEIPQANIFGTDIYQNSVSRYLGKPIIEAEDFTGKTLNVSVLKERGYYLIWNEYFRASQVVDPVLVATDDSSDIGTYNSVALNFGSACFDVMKKFDYFTSATLAPQFGESVSIFAPGSKAPVFTSEELIPDGLFKSAVGLTLGSEGNSPLTPPADGVIISESGQVSIDGGIALVGIDDTVVPSNLWADLANATLASVNNIRNAFAVQKYLERSNFAGTYFFGELAAHYGVTSPDSRLQRPEYLGGSSWQVNISQVLSTAGYAASSSTNLGETGAVSVTAHKAHIFDKAFVEPGYVYIMLCTKHDRSYTQGVLREDLKKDRLEFYSPEFANLGDQAIYNAELDVTGSNDMDVFGYQEHWAEYRYRPDRVSGLLDPSVTGSIAWWTLTDNFASRPSLGTTFLTESGNALHRALKTGDSGIDYILDAYFDYTAVREMPVYTIPGLIDHFGAM